MRKPTLQFKYNEDTTLNEITKYIKETYGQHYTTKSGAQIQDVLTDLDIGRDFCHGNAIKYLMRYGKKKGFNRNDLLKAVHYIILLMNYDKEQDKEDTMNINGFNNEVDVIQNLIDNIQNGNTDSAVDDLQQLKEVKEKEESDIDVSIQLENESKIGK